MIDRVYVCVRSASYSSALFNSSGVSGGDARWKRQPVVCGRGISDALRQVDGGIEGLDPDREHSDRKERPRPHRNSTVGHLHVHRFVGARVHQCNGRGQGQR